MCFAEYDMVSVNGLHAFLPDHIVLSVNTVFFPFESGLVYSECVFKPIITRIPLPCSGSHSLLLCSDDAHMCDLHFLAVVNSGVVNLGALWAISPCPFQTLSEFLLLLTSINCIK